MTINIPLLNEFSENSVTGLGEKSVLDVYFMPGMAANPSIFEKIKLPAEKYKIHWLEWLMPEPRESLNDYARRMSRQIRKDKPVVLIGVSFGGILVQEMSKFLKVQRLIIISSVKCRSEMPRRFRYARPVNFLKILPTRLAKHVDLFEKLAFGKFIRIRAKLYKKYLSISDKQYLDWSIEKMVYWDREEPLSEVIHIHGSRDIVFPYRYIDGCITVPGGTHIMIIMRYRWFNEHLGDIIETGKLGGIR